MADPKITIQVANQGKDGHTPVKGTDYWTEEDKAEVKGFVDDALKEFDAQAAPVKSVNGKVGEVILTAQDVGVDLSMYATQKQLQDKLDASKLPEAVNSALAQAKESGKFDGPPGEKGDTGPQGPQGEKGDTGATGPAGADGHTPVKGTDYWTAADRQSMVNDVLAALPAWEGGSY